MGGWVSTRKIKHMERLPDELKTLIASYMNPSDVYPLFTKEIKTFSFYVETIYMNRITTLRNGLVFKTIPLHFEPLDDYICIRSDTHFGEYQFETYLLRGLNKLVETDIVDEMGMSHIIQPNIWIGDFPEDVKRLVLQFEDYVRMYVPCFLQLHVE